MTPAQLPSWRVEFLAAGRPGLTTRTAKVPEDKIRDSKYLVGELTIDSECLKALVGKHEELHPLASRESKT